MGEILSRPVSQADNNRWLASISPIKGEFNAFMAGIAVAAIFQESKFGLEWEQGLMRNLQACHDRHHRISELSALMGMVCSSDFLSLYFASLYWILDQDKVIYGIWLVPISEILNGLLKWHYHVPRPAWVDSNIRLNEWSDEYSFPSSHSQIAWALANFFTFSSAGQLRNKIFGEKIGTTALMYWYLLVCPYLFAGLVSLSRVYNGLHYPRDVVVGAGLGVMLSALYIELLPHLRGFLLQFGTFKRILVMMIVPLVAQLALNSAHKKVSKEQKPSPEWTRNAARGKFQGKVLSPHDVPYSGYTAMVGVLTGLVLGINLKKFTPLDYPSCITHAISRLVVGSIILLTMFMCVRSVEKAQHKPFLARLFKFLRYAGIPVFILCLIPFVFNKLRI